MLLSYVNTLCVGVVGVLVILGTVVIVALLLEMLLERVHLFSHAAREFRDYLRNREHLKAQRNAIRYLFTELESGRGVDVEQWRKDLGL